MKRVLLPFITMLALLSMQANAQLRQYIFKNNLHENGHVIHDLDPRCAGTFATELLPAYNVTRSVYKFPWSCGLEWYDTANFIGNGTYTIEMYIKLDTVTSWRKIVDFKDRYQGIGLYQKDGVLYPYPGYPSVDTIIHAGEWEYIAFTRDAASRIMHFVVNGAVVSNDTDAVDDFKHDGTMYFFGDDSSHVPEGTYQSSGSVAFINMYNYAIDTTILKTHNHDIGVTLGITNINKTATVAATLSPNPAGNMLTVSITAEQYTYTVTDITGRDIRKGELLSGSNNIDISTLGTGIYLLKLSDGNTTTIYKFMKQ